MRIFWFGFLLIVASFTARTQPASQALGPISQLQQIVPFTTFSGGIIVFHGQLNGYPDTLNFILDTGCDGVDLDSSTCSRLRLATESSGQTIHGIAGFRRARFVHNACLKLGNILIDSLDFNVNDFNIISDAYGRKIDGIIGSSFFSRFIVKLDYDSNRMLLFSPGNMNYPIRSFKIKPYIRKIPVQSGFIKDAKSFTERFYFDTGAGLCLLLSSDFVNDSNLLYNHKKIFSIEAEGLGGKQLIKITSIKEFKLGPYKFRNVPTSIFDDKYNIISYPTLAGLIGNDILRRFNIYIDYNKSEFHLIPNSHFGDPFDFSYTGLDIFWVNGQVLVGDVMKGSPADKAGFKEGDLVVSVNGNSSGDLQVYKDMLQNVGNEIVFLIRRPSGLKVIWLKVKSIL